MWVAAGLSKPQEQYKNAGVVSSNGTCSEILVELKLGFCFHGSVQFLLILAKNGMDFF